MGDDETEKARAALARVPEGRASTLLTGASKATAEELGNVLTIIKKFQQTTKPPSIKTLLVSLASPTLLAAKAIEGIVASIAAGHITWVFGLNMALALLGGGIFAVMIKGHFDDREKAKESDPHVARAAEFLEQRVREARQVNRSASN